MDSLTQVVLGGAVAYAALGPKVGKKAVLYGAALGTLPDLDVFLPYAGEVEAFTYHRGFSHSIFVHLLFSPVLAWLLAKLHPISNNIKFSYSWIRWSILVFLCLSTHALLDACTVYGTQLMWPFTEYPFGTSNLFIIDPLYTLPLLFALIICLLPNTSSMFKHKANTYALYVSSFYICWSFVAKVVIDYKVEQAFVSNNIKVKVYMSTPAPLNTFLWRAVAMSGTSDEYYEVYASVFDSPEQVSITNYPTSPELLSNIDNDWGVQRLKWFTKGVYSISQKEDKVVLSDLRMGIECAYVFNFAVGQVTDKSIVLGDFEKVSQRPSFDGVGSIFARITDPSVKLSPERPCT